MTVLDTLLAETSELDAAEADHLSSPAPDLYAVEARPPAHNDIPATLDRFVASIKEPQTKWLKLKNTSPVIAYEIIRPNPDTLRFQYVVPSKRLERKIRTQLTEEVTGVELADGDTRLPVQEGDDVGGGFLTTGRPSWHPITTEYNKPPTNNIATSLHQHITPSTRYLIQIIYRPNIGRSLKRWYWNKRAYQHRNYLKKEKEKLWGSVKPDSREKTQARQIDHKAGQLRYTTSIRILLTNPGDYAKSRLKEVAAGFNTFENSDSGQYFNLETVRAIRPSRIQGLANAIHQRRLGTWTRSFQTTDEELAALLALPEPVQDNITPSKP